MPLSHVKRLFEHMAWADRATAASLEAAPRAAALALPLYAHLLGTELVWLDRLEGLPQSTAVWPEVGPEAILGLAERARARYAAYLAALREPDLERLVPYTNSAGRSFESRVVDILLQVALHGAYHRGQIAQLVRRAGAEPASTDYIAFVRGVPAATRKETPPR